MRDGQPPAPARHRAGPHQEGSLTDITFVGSYPTADVRLTPPLPEIAFVGRSNVGKSSLLNALVGRRALARTSQTPGKTQTCNVYRVNRTCYLVDLPGYGYARASRQARAGFRRLLEAYLATRPELGGVIWLLDVRRDPSADDLAIAEVLVRRGVPVLVALTKADKIPRAERSRRAEAIARGLGIAADQWVVTSVRQRVGIATLKDAALTLAGNAARATGGSERRA